MNTSSNASIGFKFPLRGVQLLITLMLSLFIFSEAEAQIPLANSLSAPDYIKSNSDSDDSITPFFYSGIDNDTPYSKGTSHALGFNAPTAFTGSIDQAYINAANASSITFTYSGAIVGGRYDVSVQSSGGGTASSGGIAVTSTSQTITVFCSACVYDGTVTISYTFKDGGGNPIGMFTDTRIKDTGLPSFDVAPTSSNITDTSFDLNVDMNEAGKVYYVIVTDGATAPTVADVKAGNANGGGTPATSGNTSVTTGDFSNTINIIGLSDATAYDVYAIAEDVAGNLISAVSKIDLATTADATNPVFTSATTANFAENGTGTAYTVVATDANTITYSLGTVKDEALFNIVGATGVVTFKNTPNFEDPKDGDANNTYVINIIASDGVNAANQDVTITVTNVNEDPSITSTAVTAVKDNETYSYPVFTSDPDKNNVTVAATTKPGWLTLSAVNGGVSTFAGIGTRGGVDGPGTSASFNKPYDVAVDAAGNVYAVEPGQHKIRKITSNGDVSTLAGSGTAGSADGSGTSATFNHPSGVAVDAAGNVYVADQLNHKIRKITPNGVVSTLAGTGGTGSVDGSGTSATFNYPSGVAVDAAGNVYVADSQNNKIRKIAPNGVVSTLAGTGGTGNVDGTVTSATFNNPYSIAVGALGNVYVADVNNQKIRKISSSGVVSTVAGTGARGSADGQGTSAGFNNPYGIAVGVNDTVYVADYNNHKIRKVAPTGEVTTLAGTGSLGGADGSIGTASFGYPFGVAVDATGTVFVADYSNDKIRKISSDHYLLSGAAAGNLGNHSVTLSASDGKGGTATQSFTITVNDGTAPVFENSTPSSASITSTGFTLNADIDEAGKIYYVIVSDGATSPTSTEIKAGTGNGGSGQVTSGNAEISTGDFTNAFSVAGLSGNTAYDVYVVAEDDEGTPNLQAGPTKIEITTVNTVPTFNSTAITSVNENAAYSYILATSDADGDALTLTGTTLPNWLTLKATNTVSTFAGANSTGDADGTGTDARFNEPYDVALDAAGNMYVADTYNNKIRKITPAGVVSTLAETTSFNTPEGIAVDAAGNIYVANTANHLILKIDATTEAVTTLAGSTRGFANGTGTAAQFDGPKGIAVDASGNVYVGDARNHVIRKITPEGVVSTYAGTDGKRDYRDGIGTAAWFSNPVGIAVDASGNVYVADTDNNRIRKINATTQEVTTLAGTTQGFADGTGTAAKFNGPQGVEVDASGNLYVGDTKNHKIRKITPSGMVSTLAGSTSGFADGEGSAAKFDYPIGIAVDASGIVYVAGDYDNRIRKIVQQSIKGTPTSAQIGAHTVALQLSDDKGGTVNQSFTITVADATNPVFTSLTTANFAENGTGTAYTVVATDGSTVTYSLGTAKDEASFNIVGATGVVTFKNSPNFESPTDGDASNTYVINVIASDGVNAANQDVTITVTNVNENPSITSTAVTTVNDNETYSYKIATSDLDNDVVTVSATTKPDWLTLKAINYEVTTFAGNGDSGSIDANGTSASFNNPYGVASDAAGNVYVADISGYKIRKITPNGDVTTFAGSGTTGSTDGLGTNASFYSPYGLAVDKSGNVYVADRNLIRKITPNGNVTTLAGSVTSGSTDANGASASFNLVSAIAVDAAGYLYVSDNRNHKIRKIAPNGDVTTLAGSGAAGSADANGVNASFNYPRGIAVNAAGYVYVADSYNNKIRKIAPNGDVTTLAGTGSQGAVDGSGTNASFAIPTGLTLDVSGNLFVSQLLYNKIRKVTPNGNVTTLAGSVTGGSTDGIGTSASFSSPMGLAIDAAGNIYVSDQSANNIRKISSYYLLSGSAEGHSGKHNVTLSASDGNGATATQTFVIDVSRVLTPDANNILYVNKSVSGGNNRGGSWANAVTELADALVWAKENYDNAWATTPLKIYVAKGTYKPLYSPEDGVKFGTNQSRDNSFLMVNNVQVYGGFDPGNGIDDLTDTRILPSTGSTGTILTGDVNDDDESDFTNISENSIRVIVSSGDVGKALLNGFTITGANGENNNDITVNGNPVYQCSGAGVYNSKSSPTYENLLLFGNHNTESGGGMFSYQSSPKVRNSVFRNNKAKDGGAMANQDNSSPVLSNVIFIKNEATANGGAIYNVDSSTPTFVNITVVGNTDTGGGDGIYNSNLANPALHNSIIWDVVNGTYTAKNSLIKGQTDTDNGNLDATGVTNASIFTDYDNGDYTLKHNSPAVDAGSNALYTNAGADIANDVDFAGNPRLYDGPPAADVIDLGVYEYRDIINPVLTSLTTASFVENGSGTVYTVTATDANTIAYSLGTANDEALFSIVGATGVVTFKTAPDFENPIDGDANNTYVINVIASDGKNTVNQNVTITVTDIDEIKPTVVVTSASTSPNSGAFNITVTFSESVTGFVIGDLTVGNGVASNFAGSGTTYTATITPSADGAVTVDVAAAVAQDAASNTNTAATQFSITNDQTKPSVTIASAPTSPTSGAFNVTITFSETVTGFVIGDLTVANGAASNFAGSGTTYTATVTPSTDGVVRLNVAASVAQDAAANTNTAATQFSITNDETKPSVLVTSTSSVKTSGAFNVTVTFSEAVTDFVVGDLTVTNGVASSFVGFGTTYTANVTPSADGLVTVNVAAGVAQDAANNTNTAAPQFSITNDETKPTVITTSNSINIFSGAFDVTFTFSESVTGFAIGDLTIGNGTASNFAGTGTTYTATITPSADGVVTVNVAAAVAQDAANNTNTAATQLSITNDQSKPSVTLTAGSTNPVAGVYVITAQFSEGVIGFSLDDIKVVGGVAYNLVTVDADTYTFSVTSANSSATVNIAEGVAIDVVGNYNTTSNTLSLIFNLAPTSLALSNTSISENNSIGQLIGNLSTIDADATDTHTYSLVSGTGATDNASFTVAGNKLQAAEIFDFEIKTSYSVRVKTDDGRGGTFEKQFTISVTNIEEPKVRVVSDFEIPATALGLTSNFDVTIHNDGDAALIVNSVLYPNGFVGLVTGLIINPGESKVVTLGFMPTEVKIYTGTISFITNAGTVSITVSGEGAIITGVDDGFIDAEEINIFPNPAQDILNIDLSELGNRTLDISIINASGIPIFTKTKVTDKALRLNVSGYTNGLYIVQFTDGISVVRKKVMIKR